MLETGKICYRCGIKRLLKDFSNNKFICNECDLEERKDFALKQYKLKKEFNKGDKTIINCCCGTFFKQRNEEKRRRICLNNGARMQTAIFGTMDDGEQSKQLIEKNYQKQKNVELGDKKMQNTIESTKENTIIEIDQQYSGKFVMDVSGETHFMDYTQRINFLDQEISTSITLLNESTQLLLSTAKTMTNDYKGDFNNETLRKPTIDQVDAALRLILGVNELQKTKTNIIREQRETTNNMFI